MHRRHLFYVTAPTVCIGLLMLAGSLAGTHWINQLQSNHSTVMARNVISLQAAQELEIRIRQLRFHSLAYAIEPTEERRMFIEQDHNNFEIALERARQSAATEEERVLVAEIENSYRQYKIQLAADEQPLSGTSRVVLRWIDKHPVSDLVAPCHELLRINQLELERTTQENERISSLAQITTWLLAVVGPLGGLIGGYGLAYGLSRSITWLNIWVHDVHEQLDQPIGSIKVTTEQNVPTLDIQVQEVVQRVQDMVDRITEQQRQLLHAEQLAAVGQLAAGLAHEIRNPLTTMKLLVGVAMRGGPGAGLTSDDLQMMHREIVRLEHTVQGLLDFARPPETQRQTCNLSTLVQQAVDLVRVRLNQQRIPCIVEVPNEPPALEVDPGQFCSVVVNLLLNALDAMPMGGQLRVRLSRHEGQLTLQVEDNGTGIAPDVKDRLFTPFVTTRPTGTGLGLPICRRIVENHGGSIEGHNRSEGGAVFTIRLPLDKELHRGETAGHRR